MLYENPLNAVDGKACFYQDLSFKKILDFFKTILENDTIYHNNPFVFDRDLHEPLVSIDNLRADLLLLKDNYDGLKTDYDGLKTDYDHLFKSALPLLELSQTTSFKIYHKTYQKTLPLLRMARRLVEKVGRIFKTD